VRPRQFVIALPVAGIAALGAFAASDAYGEFAARGGHVETPESSIEQPEHHGLRAHTNYKMFVPNAGGMASARRSSLEAPAQAGGPPYAGYSYETPASLGCVYILVSSVPGCNPNIVNANPTGGGHAIAIVDAYHYSTAMRDLQVFSAQFGLPLPTSANFQVVYANGRQPPVNANWNVEEALDIEWAHAMAPNAKIYLVEAASSNFSDLLRAVSVANTR
jgi:kumamolisin